MNDSASSTPELDAPRASGGGSPLGRPASLFARAVGWGVVRTLVGLLAAGILLSYAANTG